MTQLTIASRTTGRLEIERAESPYGHEVAWTARLYNEGLVASLIFPEEGWAAESLASFFARLDQSSSHVGHEAISWKAEEDEFSLTATRPLKNTVLLQARLQSPARWAAEATLETDPGLYQEVARLARDLSGD